MNLDEKQKQQVSAWIQEGQSLSQIQNRLASELGIRLTYMEARFLLDDLKLRPKDKEIAQPVTANLAQKPTQDSVKSPTQKSQSPQKENLQSPDPQSPAAKGRVAVQVDQITRAGALASGNVTFSDGNAAEWYLDQYGRLGLVPKTPGYKPSQPDLMTFQNQLQNELAKLGL